MSERQLMSGSLPGQFKICNLCSMRVRVDVRKLPTEACDCFFYGSFKPKPADHFHEIHTPEPHQCRPRGSEHSGQGTWTVDDRGNRHAVHD